MRFSIRHETVYRYATPVALAPHVLRLSPRAGAGRITLEEIEVEPNPISMRPSVDLFGNRIHLLSFDGVTDLLRIESRIGIVNPPQPQGLDASPLLPWAPLPEVLHPYLPREAQAPQVESFAHALAEEQFRVPLAFLESLNAALHARSTPVIRPEGAAQDPAETLRSGRGACRDIAVLFIACCRCLGIPARFVSGYQALADSPDGRRHLHGWPEVWLPDSGWRGFDPTHGTAVGDGHVALCAAPQQAGTMPVEGSYYGPPVESSLRYRVDIATGP